MHKNKTSIAVDVLCVTLLAILEIPIVHFDPGVLN